MDFRFKVDRIRNHDGFDAWVEVSWSRWSLLAPWRIKRCSGVLIGSGTVWNWYPTGNRATTPMESWLADRWTAWRWKK